MPADSYGYVKISRKAYQEDPYWNESRVFSKWEAWEDMIQMASFSERSFSVGLTTVTLARGEFMASIRFLCLRWRWSRGKVMRFLEACSEADRIVKKNETSDGTIYALVNYETYQGSRDTNGDSSGTAAGQQRDKSEEGKKEKKKKSAPPRAARPAPEIPESLSDAIPEFPSLWARRMKAAGKKPSPTAEQAQVDSLAEWVGRPGGKDVVLRAVEEATRGGWQGIFPEKAATLIKVAAREEPYPYRRFGSAS